MVEDNNKGLEGIVYNMIYVYASRVPCERGACDNPEDVQTARQTHSQQGPDQRTDGTRQGARQGKLRETHYMWSKWTWQRFDTIDRSVAADTTESPKIRTDTTSKARKREGFFSINTSYSWYEVITELLELNSYEQLLGLH